MIRSGSITTAASSKTLFPDIQTVTRCIEDQPQGIFDDATLKGRSPRSFGWLPEMEREGLDGLFVSCAEDPAVDSMIRQTAKIPVLGAGTASALMALSYRKPVGVLGLDARAPTPMHLLLERPDDRCSTAEGSGQGP